MAKTLLKILLIDDDEDAFVVTRHLLSSIRSMRLKLDWVQTYEQGLETIARHEHDLYLIDYRLNGHDGLELLKEALARGCRAPMIILTGLKDHEVDLHAMEAGAADYLVKDRVDAAHLERCIRYSLERQRLHDELEDKARRLRTLAEQLSQAEQAERSRVARLLHDHLQQILVSAKMHLERITAENFTQQRQRAQDLLDQVIRISRELSAELSPPILMDAGLAAGLSWLAGQMAKTHGLHVETRIDAEAEPEAEVVRLMLFHAVRELLFNIVKHARVSQASLLMERVDQQVRIVVTDQGAGFDPKVIDQTAPSSGNAGIAHLRERIQLIGGHLEVCSEPGHGCRISLLAPRMASASTRAQDGEPQRVAKASVLARWNRDDAVPGRANQRIRVLLADDHPVLRDGLARTLADQSDIHVVGEAADGQETLEMARQLEPDVIIMDVVMPRLNGLDATRRILSEMPGIQVIGLSMHSDPQMADAMRKVGAAAYVSKGQSIETLLQYIRGHVAT